MLKMNCSTKKLKNLVLVLSFLCAFLGFILGWFGIWLRNSIDNVKIDHGENLAVILTILLGVVIIFTSIFGCAATCRDSKMMLTSFSVVLVILVVIQFIMVTISYTTANEGLSDELKRGFDELWESDNTSTNSSLAYYEEWLHCCGKNGAEDYFLLDKIPPPSCCLQHDCTNILNLYVLGCELKFKDYIRSKTENFNTLSWFLIVIEFTSSIISCILVDRLRNHRDRVRFYS